LFVYVFEDRLCLYLEWWNTLGSFSITKLQYSPISYCKYNLWTMDHAGLAKGRHS